MQILPLLFAATFTYDELGKYFSFLRMSRADNFPRKWQHSLFSLKQQQQLCSSFLRNLLASEHQCMLGRQNSRHHTQWPCILATVIMFSCILRGPSLHHGKNNGKQNTGFISIDTIQKDLLYKDYFLYFFF